MIAADELAIYTRPAAVVPVGDDYRVTVGNNAVVLQRDSDFGVIPGTKKPSLYKSGAERIIMSFGVSTNFEIVRSIENVDSESPFFFYLVRCSMDKVMPDGQVVHITDGYGSANTGEKKCGHANAFDMANTQLKIAKKRALVDGALLIGQLSNLFSQDIENESFMGGADKVGTILNDTDPITPKQKKRIFALAASNGISTSKAKELIASAGFESTSDITQADYDRICALFTGETEAANGAD